jgi:hypothetical protein
MSEELTDLDLSGPGIIEVLSQHMPGRNEKSTKIHS